MNFSYIEHMLGYLVSNQLLQLITCSLIILHGITTCSVAASQNSPNQSKVMISFSVIMWALCTVTEVKMVDTQPTEPSPTELG